MRLDYSSALLTVVPTYIYFKYIIDTCYQFPPGRRTERPSFVAKYVLGMRCVVYVKGLGETYTTLDRRLLLLLRLITPKTGRAGNFKIVDVFDAKKKLRKKFLVESAGLIGAWYR